jgi:flavin-binding protein dodecin
MNMAKTKIPDSAVFRVTDVIGTSKDWWEDAAKNAVDIDREGGF